MPEKTANLGLTKPLVTEKYDVGVFNANSEILDAAHAEMNRRINELKDISPPVKEVADYTQGDVFDFSIMDVGMCFEILYDSTTEFEDAPELLPLGGETGRMIFEVEELPSGAAVQTIVCLGKCGGVFRRDGVNLEWNEWRMISAPKMEINANAGATSLYLTAMLSSAFPWASDTPDVIVYGVSPYAPYAYVSYGTLYFTSTLSADYVYVIMPCECKDFVYSHPLDGSRHLNETYRRQITFAAEQAMTVKTVIGDNYNILENTCSDYSMHGIDFTINEDKSVTANGTATADVIYEVGRFYADVSVHYYLTGLPSGAGEDNYCYQKRLGGGSAVNIASSQTFYSNTTSATCVIYIYIKAGTTVENITFYPMVTYGYYGLTSLPYVPYTVPLQTQINNIWQNQYEQDDQIATAILNAGDALIDIKEIRDILAVVKSDTAVTKATVGMEKKNLLKNTAATTTKNGITFTVNADGSITADGTATTNTSLDIGKIVLTAGTEYVLSGCPEGGSDTSYYLYGLYTSNWAGTGGKDIGKGYEFPAPWNGEVVFRIYIASGATVSGLTFYPMVRYAEITDDTYEQYKHSIEERLAALEAALAVSVVEGGE